MSGAFLDIGTLDMDHSSFCVCMITWGVMSKNEYKYIRYYGEIHSTSKSNLIST